MCRSALTSKGRVTIPRQIRRRLGIKAGDILEFTVDTKGRIVASSPQAARGVDGSLRDFAPDEAVSVEAMNQVIRTRPK